MSTVFEKLTRSTNFYKEAVPFVITGDIHGFDTLVEKFLPDLEFLNNHTSIDTVYLLADAAKAGQIDMLRHLKTLDFEFEEVTKTALLYSGSRGDRELFDYMMHESGAMIDGAMLSDALFEAYQNNQYHFAGYFLAYLRDDELYSDAIRCGTSNENFIYLNAILKSYPGKLSELAKEDRLFISALSPHLDLDFSHLNDLLGDKVIGRARFLDEAEDPTLSTQDDPGKYTV